MVPVTRCGGWWVRIAAAFGVVALVVAGGCYSPGDGGPGGLGGPDGSQNGSDSGGGSDANDGSDANGGSDTTHPSDVGPACTFQFTPDGGTSEFSCGGKMCRRGEEYCRVTTGGAVGPDGGTSTSYACREVPSNCGGTTCCTCIRQQSGAPNSSSCDQIGPGAYRLSVAAP